ncbi:MAG: UbiX family flavin prenyltransferase [Chlamydiales bacterium]|nr:UbiX family flavin prenyltransferase [Chlamydiales bacterium]
MGRYVVGVSGASGVVLALHTLRALTDLGHRVELTLSQYALYTATLELGKGYATAAKFLSHIEKRELITLHSNQDVGCAIASGSFVTDGMIVIPCSVATLAAVAHGLGDNALRRAADVTVKEKRPLILVPREAPFSEIHIENMLKLSRLGATIIPPVPAWYTEPKSIQDVEKFIVGKVLDALKLDHNLYPRWKSSL